MAKAKKTTKKVDYRKVTDWYSSYIEDKAEDMSNYIVKKSARGFMDYRVLLKKLNGKIASAFEDVQGQMLVSTDDKQIIVSVSLKDFAYTNNGYLIRILVEIDDRVSGALDKKVYTYIVSPDSFVGKHWNTVHNVITRINTIMGNKLEREFNRVLFNNGLAPSSDILYPED